MKNLLLVILGAVVAWLVLSFITKDFEIIEVFDIDTLIILIIGIVLGYSIGKKEKATSN